MATALCASLITGYSTLKDLSEYFSSPSLTALTWTVGFQVSRVFIQVIAPVTPVFVLPGFGRFPRLPLPR